MQSKDYKLLYFIMLCLCFTIVVVILSARGFRSCPRNPHALGVELIWKMNKCELRGIGYDPSIGTMTLKSMEDSSEYEIYQQPKRLRMGIFKLNKNQPHTFIVHTARVFIGER